MAKKKLESWTLWIMADIIAISVYSLNCLYFTIAAYLELPIMEYLELRSVSLIFNKMLFKTIE